MLHLEERRPIELGMARPDSVAGVSKHAHPVADEMAFPGGHVVETAGQGRGAAAAHSVAHDEDFLDLELRNRELECGRDPVVAAARLVRRRKGGDVARDEHLARPRVENLGGIASAVGAGQDHDLRNAPAAVPPKQRKPDWIRVKAPTSPGYHATRRLMRDLNLATVCEEAACPNIGECWTKKHATVMILGDTCTRACAFCNVKTGMPRAVDPLEPEHVATAAAELGLEHIVVTSVDRDDLPDGGASQFVKVIQALRRNTPNTTIEILTPDFRNKAESAIDAIVEAGPDVYNHNLETVPRLYPTIRPGARYYASLRLLESVKRKAPHIFTKSGVMVGLGEERLEVHQVMDDMRSAGVDFLTMGQYLQPTPRHAKVEEFVTPRAFDAYAAGGPEADIVPFEPTA